MAWDTHFLSRLNRVNDDHVALAMSLYRDPELVKAVLDRAAPSGSGDERFALALEDAPEGPHIVLARNGHFVTCLGPGMKVGDLPIISRARLDAAKSQLIVLKERLAAAEREFGPGGEGSGALVTRLQHAGPRLSREEFLAFLTLVPFLWPRLMVLAANTALALGRERDRLARRRGNEGESLAARSFAHGLWMVNHIAGLVFAEWPGREEMLDRLASFASSVPGTFVGLANSVGSVPGVLRTAHALGRIGKPFLPVLKKLWLEDERKFVSGAPLLVAAHAHRKLAGEIDKHFARGTEPAIGTMFRNCIEKWEEMDAGVLGIGRLEACVRLAVGDRPIFTHPEEVPPEVAGAVLASMPLSLNDEEMFEAPFMFLPYIARLRAEDLYLPARLAPHLHYPLAEDETFLLLDAIPDEEFRQEPVRAGPRVGRNDPCTCGSGKKFKKCCAA